MDDLSGVGLAAVGKCRCPLSRLVAQTQTSTIVLCDRQSKHHKARHKPRKGTSITSDLLSTYFNAASLVYRSAPYHGSPQAHYQGDRASDERAVSFSMAVSLANADILFAVESRAFLLLLMTTTCDTLM